MKKHFLKCRSITDGCNKPDSQGSTSDGGQLGSKSLKSHHSGNSGSKAKEDKDDRCGNEEKGDRTHGSKSKTDGKVTSQDDLQESPHRSMHIARSSAAGRSQEDMGKVPHTHQSHKKLKKHGKSSHKKLHH